MSYNEYFDLFILAQENKQSPYYMVSFDVVNSQLLSEEENIQMHKNIEIIMKYVYIKLSESEKKMNCQILIKDKRFFRPWESIHNGILDCNYMDPWCFGDCFQFTVLRDTINKDKIIMWVKECMEKLNMREEFHVADGYYETNNYEEGKNKFFRGYCIKTLETFHKPQVQKQLKEIRKHL